MQDRIAASLKSGKVSCYIHKPGIIQGFDPDREAPRLQSSLRLLFHRSISLGGGYTVFMK
jgi:hypothetical protein